MRRLVFGVPVLVAVLVGAGETNVMAAIVFQYLGNTHPTSQGWTEVVAAPAGGGVTAGSVHNDLGLDAWFVKDDSTAVPSRLSYWQTPTDAQIAEANSFGWKLSTIVRVVNTPDTVDTSLGVRYFDGTNRYGMFFGSEEDGDPIVFLGKTVIDNKMTGPNGTVADA